MPVTAASLFCATGPQACASSSLVHCICASVALFDLFHPEAHFARPPAAGTATAGVESTHGFGYASDGATIRTGALVSSILPSVHELSHGAT